MTRRRLWTHAVFVWLALAGSLHAGQAAAPADPAGQDLASLALEDLMKLEVRTVVAASKFVQDVAQAPASVTVVTAEEPLDLPNLLAEIARVIAGAPRRSKSPAA